MASSESEVEDRLVAAADPVEVTIDGTLVVPADPLAALEVETDDGRRIRITLATGAVVRPARRQATLAAGDRVCVIGAATEYAFVPDTGGQREPPDRVLAAISAQAIGVGSHATRDAAAAHERFLSPRAPTNPRRLLLFVLAVVLTAASLAMIGLEPVFHAGTVGYGTTVGLVALAVWWCTSTDLSPFPGGASSELEEPVPNTLAVVIITSWFVLLSGVIALLAGSSAPERLLFGTMGAWIAGVRMSTMFLGGLFASSRETVGVQVLLPRSALARWTLAWGSLVLWLGSIVVAIVGCVMWPDPSR